MNFWPALLLLIDAGKPIAPNVPPPQEMGLEGIYRSATNEGGKKAAAAVTVERLGTAYIVHWSTGAKGVGLRQGGTLSVGWTQNLGGGGIMRGVTVYAISGRTLRGRWAALIPGKVMVSEEVLTWLGDLEE